MRAWKRRLETLGGVRTFDYPYMRQKKKRPDRHDALVAAHRAAIARARRAHPGPLVLAGKSMGSRIGCHVAADTDEAVRALICFGYPLLGMGKTRKLRDQVLLSLRTPILFIQGTRDTLCPLDLLESTRARMSAQNELHVVDGGDHSLLVTKTALRARNETQADVDARILSAIATFLARTL